MKAVVARSLGRRPGFPSSSPQTGWPRHFRMPPERTLVTLVPHGSWVGALRRPIQVHHPNSTPLAFVFSLLLGRLLRILLLIKQEGFGIEVRQRCVGFQYFALGDFSLRQRCRQHHLLLVRAASVSASAAVMEAAATAAATVSCSLLIRERSNASEAAGVGATYSLTGVGAVQPAASSWCCTVIGR